MLVVLPLRGIAKLFYWLDRLLIDGLVNLTGKIPLFFGSGLRRTQRGMLQTYGGAMAWAVLILIGVFLFLPAVVSRSGETTEPPAAGSTRNP